MTVEALVPISQIPIIKQAARELGIEMITGEVKGESMVCHFLLYDYGSLISIGFFAGVNSYYTSISQPIKEFHDKLDGAINKITKENGE